MNLRSTKSYFILRALSFEHFEKESRNNTNSEFESPNISRQLRLICSDCNLSDCSDIEIEPFQDKENPSDQKPIVQDATCMGIIQANSKLPPSSNKISPHNTKPPNCKPYVENIASLSNTLGPENTSLDNPSNCELEFKRRDIHIANLNIRHLKPKIDQMKILLDQSNSIDIFGLCKTFSNESIEDSSVLINGYKIEPRNPRCRPRWLPNKKIPIYLQFMQYWKCKSKLYKYLSII